MQLTPDRSIRLDRLARAWTTGLIDLGYLRLAPDQSLFDPAFDGAREDAVANFLTYLEDAEEEDVEEVRRATAWVLNLADERFAQVVYRLRIPYPRNDPADIHRFVALLWERAWGEEDWHVPGFAPDAYDVAW